MKLYFLFFIVLRQENWNKYKCNVSTIWTKTLNDIFHVDYQNLFMKLYFLFFIVLRQENWNKYKCNVSTIWTKTLNDIFHVDYQNLCVTFGIF